MVPLVAAGFLSVAVTAAGADKTPAGPPSQPSQLVWPAGGRPVRLVASIPSAQAGKAAQQALQRPFGVAVDGAGRILVADTGQRAVVVYQNAADAGAQWKGNAQFALFGPLAVAPDPSGKTFAVDGHRARVLVFDGSGAPVAEFGKDQLQRPVSIAIDAQAGKLLVGDVRAGQIFVFNLASLQLERTLGNPGNPAFGRPAQIAVNSKGHILVGGDGRCRISILEPDGTLVKEFPTECGAGQAERTTPMAVDAKDRIYVADPSGTGTVQVFDPEGKPLQLIRLAPDASKEILPMTGIAVDQDSKLYVLEQKPGLGRLRIFSQGKEPNQPSKAAADRRQK